jgi:hypothetical protein
MQDFRHGQTLASPACVSGVGVYIPEPCPALPAKAGEEKLIEGLQTP